MVLEAIRCEVVDWVHLVQGETAVRILVDTVLDLRVT
jgi:hypothetical protein